MLSAAMIRPPSVAKRRAALDPMTASTTAYSGAVCPSMRRTRDVVQLVMRLICFPPSLLRPIAAVLCVLRYFGRIDVTR